MFYSKLFSTRTQAYAWMEGEAAKRGHVLALGAPDPDTAHKPYFTHRTRKMEYFHPDGQDGDLVAVAYEQEV